MPETISLSAYINVECFREESLQNIPPTGYGNAKSLQNVPSTLTRLNTALNSAYNGRKHLHRVLHQEIPSKYVIGLRTTRTTFRHSSASNENPPSCDCLGFLQTPTHRIHLQINQATEYHVIYVHKTRLLRVRCSTFQRPSRWYFDSIPPESPLTWSYLSFSSSSRAKYPTSG